MGEKRLQIVSFNIPYPPDYGGAIDVFYKIKALCEQGVKITLHAFEYGRDYAPVLERYCEKIYYYQRKTGYRSQLSVLPYITYSRRNKELLANLQKTDEPVLFEGLHTCYYLAHTSLKNKIKLVRAHNIEHLYYKGLAKNTHCWKKKLFFLIESVRLKRFEKRLRHADYILTLSATEQKHFEQQYGKEKTVFVPLFFRLEQPQNIDVSEKPYVLIHGDMSSPENVFAARYMIEKLVPLKRSIAWIVAGKDPDDSLLAMAEKHPNVSVRANIPEDEMFQLIRQATVNLLYTNQCSGVKLKLLNVLYNGKHCIANAEMTRGSGLESLCRTMPDNPEDTIRLIEELLITPFLEQEAESRRVFMKKWYNNENNAQKIMLLL